jgi:geranylgeranyl diphosphate synthase type II
MMNLTDLQKEYEKHLSSHPFTGKPSNLYDSMNYILSLGGKRVRPLLAIIGNQIANGEIHHGLEVAHIIELFHNFSLIHDDIMDQADIRRGQPTVHKKWDEPTAILSGDNMLVKTFEYLLNYQGPNREIIAKIYTQTAIGVCEGQQLDMDYAQIPNSVHEDDYLNMIKLKTAILLGCSLECGFLSGGGHIEDSALFYDFAINVGMSFQLMDDYLDAFGDELKTGKKEGGDIIEGKNTWLKIKSHDLFPEKTETLFSMSPEERVNPTIEFWKSQQIDQELILKANEYHQNALSILNTLTQKGYNIQLLDDLAHWLLDRQH